MVRHLLCGALAVSFCLPVLAAEEVAKTKPTFVFDKTGKILLDTGPKGSFDSSQAKYPCVPRMVPRV